MTAAHSTAQGSFPGIASAGPMNMYSHQPRGIDIASSRCRVCFERAKPGLAAERHARPARSATHGDRRAAVAIK